MTFPSLVFLLALTGRSDSPSPMFTPVGADRLYAERGAELTVRLRLASGAAANPLACRVVDYAGNLVNQGRLCLAAPDQWELSLQTVQGFLEIELPSSGQRFGVLWLPAWKGKDDSAGRERSGRVAACPMRSAYVTVGTFVAILKSKARQLLANSPGE